MWVEWLQAVEFMLVLLVSGGIITLSQKFNSLAKQCEATEKRLDAITEILKLLVQLKLRTVKHGADESVNKADEAA